MMILADEAKKDVGFKTQIWEILHIGTLSNAEDGVKKKVMQRLIHDVNFRNSLFLQVWH